MTKMKKYLSLIAAFIFCPCHLPIWAGVFAGSAFGTFLAQNLLWAAIGLSAFFLLAVAYASRLWFKEQS